MNDDAGLLIIEESGDISELISGMFSENCHITTISHKDQLLQFFDENPVNLQVVLIHCNSSNDMWKYYVDMTKQYQESLGFSLILCMDLHGTGIEPLAYELGVEEILYQDEEYYVIMHRIEHFLDLYTYRNEMQQMVDDKSKDIENHYQQLKEQYQKLVSMLYDVIAYRSIESEDHIDRVQRYTEILAKNYAKVFPQSHMTEQKIYYISMASRIHDIGKLTLPDSILRNPGRLSVHEMNLLKLHTETGGTIVQALSAFVDPEFARICYNVCTCHHEKYDGTGYPKKVRRDRIPIEAQLVGLADMYDTLANKMPEGEEYSREEISAMLLEGKCGGLSPAMLKCFEHAKFEMESV